MHKSSVLLHYSERWIHCFSEFIVEIYKKVLLFTFHQSLFKRFCQVKLSFLHMLFLKKGKKKKNKDNICHAKTSQRANNYWLASSKSHFGRFTSVLTETLQLLLRWLSEQLNIFFHFIYFFGEFIISWAVHFETWCFSIIMMWSDYSKIRW